MCNGWACGWNIHFKKMCSSYMCWWLWYNAVVIYKESLSLASCISASCRNINCFELFWLSWKLNSGSILVLEFSLVHKTLLISISSISVGCNVPIIVFLGMCTAWYAVLSRGMFSEFGYLWSILWLNAMEKALTLGHHWHWVDKYIVIQLSWCLFCYYGYSSQC